MLHDPIDPRDRDPIPIDSYNRYSEKTLWVSVVKCTNPICNGISRIFDDAETCPWCGSDVNGIEAIPVGIRLDHETGEVGVM
jgi:hypothetical protein